MYSGCITEIGTVIETRSGLVIEATKTAAGLSPGGSVSVNGTCVSAVQVDAGTGRFRAEISAETANRSTLGDLAPGATVNLELPLRVGDALDGHLVQGHTDAIGKVTKVDAEPGGSRRVWIRPPKRFLDEIVAKGSVAVTAGTTTGVSAHDRAATIRRLAHPDAVPADMLTGSAVERFALAWSLPLISISQLAAHLP